MFTKLLDTIGHPADIRSAAAILLAILATIFGTHSQIVTTAVDSGAAFIVALDVALARGRTPTTTVVSTHSVTPTASHLP